MIPRLFFASLLLACVSAVQAFEPFRVEEIRVEGLQRISVGTVFNYLPVKTGELLDEKGSSAAIRALYRTGFFEDVALEREGDTLVVFVEERPAIADVEIKGNEDLETEQLSSFLKQVGLVEGRVFDPSMLDTAEQQLQQQYLNLGKYNAQVETEVIPRERNRVSIRILIDEGRVATIQQVNILGNRAYGDPELLNLFESGPRSPLAIFSSRDEYSKQKLAGDLETLRSYYLDRGYINFNIESTQVSITPDRRQVYITINVSEGERFKVGDVSLAGETIVPEEELAKLISIKPGDIFSRREVTESAARISEALGDRGYAFANINPIPELDEERNTVSLRYFIDPGERIYVRRINIGGNIRTKDEVVRRELRQLEGAWLSTANIKRSRTRLMRLGYFDDVSVETPVVPGQPDQVDVSFKVLERETFGSLNAGIGYGEGQGFLVNASVVQDNFLGTGQRFSLNFNNSEVNTIYSFSFTDPYFTPEGISRRINLSYRETDTTESNTAVYNTDSYGAGVQFGVPVSEFDTVRYGLDYEFIRLKTTSSSPSSITSFCGLFEDCSFDTFKFATSWSHDTRNRAIFPDSGTLLTLGSEIALPVGDDSLNFYKLRYSQRHYFPLGYGISFSLNGELAYADVYNDTESLPPFEKYFAGGTRTVRGYRANTLGPRDNGDPIGGNARAIGNLELIFPTPFMENSNSARFVAFFDAGTVDRTLENAFDNLRYSAGVSFQWLTPVGPMTFSLARALNADDQDETESFQFTLGTL